MGLLNGRTFEKPLASSRSVTGPTLLASIGPQKTAKYLCRAQRSWHDFRGQMQVFDFLRGSLRFVLAFKSPYQQVHGVGDYGTRNLTFRRIGRLGMGVFPHWVRSPCVGTRLAQQQASRVLAARALACVTGAGFVTSALGSGVWTPPRLAQSQEAEARDAHMRNQAVSGAPPRPAVEFDAQLAPLRTSAVAEQHCHHEQRP